MSDTFSTLSDALSPIAAKRIDEICDCFEAAWLAGQRPAIEEHVKALTGAERQSLLRELIRLEVEYRRSGGEQVHASDYRTRFPELDKLWLQHLLMPATISGMTPAAPATPVLLRCPHCHNPIQLGDGKFEDVLCPGCGGHFRVRDAGATTTTTGMAPLGKFQLLRRVGLGAFGAVWKARDTELQRTVALKIPHARLLSVPHDLERFQREARAVAQLRHPGIVTVHEVVMLQGLPTLVSDFIEGVPLNELLEERPLTFREAAALLVELAAALDHAHNQGLVHRDIKPANIMIEHPRPTGGEDATVELNELRLVGKPVLLDFGIALREDVEITLTREGDVVGTPAYMSPEQAAGRSHQVDRRSDVYSLGVILYQLLCGELPFRGSTLMLMRQVQFEEPRSLRSLNDKIPRDLETICLKCLEKDPRSRYASAAALADDLQRWLRDEPIRARPAGRLERGWRWSRRNPLVASLIAALVLVLVLGFSGVLWKWLEAEQATHEALAQAGIAKKQQENTEDARRQATAAELKAKRRLFDAKLAQAQALRGSRQTGRRVLGWQVLTEAAELARELGLGEEHLLAARNEAIACLALVDLRLIKRWEGFPPGSTSGLAFDGNLERYARSDTKGNISVRRVKDDVELMRLPGDGRGNGSSGAAVMRFSPNGEFLAVKYWHQSPGSSTNFRLWDWQRGKTLFLPSFPVYGDALNFSPDSRYLALGLANNTVTIHDLPSGKEIKAWRNQGFLTSHLAFHPDGRQLALANSQNDVQVLDINTGKLSRRLASPSRLSHLDWHPDGNLLGAGGSDYNVYLWNSSMQQPQSVLHGHRGGGVRVAFAGNGPLISTAWDSTARLWDPWSGRELLRFASEASYVSRDGSYLASQTASELAHWEVTGGKEYRSLPVKGGLRGAFSPDSRWLALACDDGLRLWNLALDKEVGRLPISRTSDARFHPSSKSLFTSGDAGVYHWPFQVRASSLQIGPARKLLPSLFDTWGQLGLDQQGHTLTVLGNNTKIGFILDVENPSRSPRSFSQTDAMTVAITPDACWVATGTHNGLGVNIWESRTGKLVRTLLPDERQTSVAFSPDNRWLVIGTNRDFGIWEVGSWNLLRTLRREQAGNRGTAVFSSDGKILALTMSPTAIQLLDTATDRELARLTVPESELMWLLGFSPDGGYIAAESNRTIHLWDLRRIGRQLQQIGLDWQPRSSPSAPRPAEETITHIEIVYGDFPMPQGKVR